MKHEELVDQNVNVSGAGKVELFDEREKKVLEVPFTNLITDLGLEELRWWQMYGIMVNMPSAIAPSLGDQIWSKLNPRRSDCFQMLWLKDSSLAEGTANEGRAFGQTVGYARRNVYAGADTKLGSFNPTETTVNTDTISWVFDWSTLAANGTFQSLCWAGSGSTEPPPHFAADLLDGKELVGTSAPYIGLFQGFNNGSGSGSSNYYGWGFIELPDGSWLRGPGSGYCYGVSGTRASWRDGVRSFVGASYTTLGMSEYVRGDLACDGTNVYFCNATTVKRITVAEVASPTPTVTTVTTSGWTGMCGIAWDGAYLWIADNATNKVYRTSQPDASGTIEREWTFPNSATENVVSLAWEASSGHLLMTTDAGKLYEMDIDGAVVACWDLYYKTQQHTWYPNAPGNQYSTGNNQPGYVGSTSLGGQMSIEVASNGDWILSPNGYGTYTNYVYQMVPESLGTRAVLAAPVTKSNLQTLKITYSFTFS